jgi:hypothetical protein
VNRTEVIKAFGAVRGDALAVAGPGLAGYQIAEHADHVLTMYNQDMAYVSSTALGMALAWPGRGSGGPSDLRGGAPTERWDVPHAVELFR